MAEVDKEIVNILVAISKLEEVQKNTIKNVDKLTLSIERLIPENLAKRVDDLEEENKLGIRSSTLKNILGAIFFLLVTFGTWLVISIFTVQKDISLLQNSIIEDKNQITYLKGRLKAQNE